MCLRDRCLSLDRGIAYRNGDSFRRRVYEGGFWVLRCLRSSRDLQSRPSVELASVLWGTVGVENSVLEFDDPLSEHVDLSDELILSPVHFPESLVHFVVEFPDV